MHPIPTQSLDCITHPLLVSGVNLAPGTADSTSLTDDRLEFPRCGDAMRPVNAQKWHLTNTAATATATSTSTATAMTANTTETAIATAAAISHRPRSAERAEKPFSSSVRERWKSCSWQPSSPPAACLRSRMRPTVAPAAHTRYSCTNYREHPGENFRERSRCNFVGKERENDHHSSIRKREGTRRNCCQSP